jgi:hypothetical protein
LSYVHPEDLGLQEKVESFSGYFTVGNPKCDSNLFFWFFPAKVSLPNVLNLHRCTVVDEGTWGWKNQGGARGPDFVVNCILISKFF